MDNLCELAYFSNDFNPNIERQYLRFTRSQTRPRFEQNVQNNSIQERPGFRDLSPVPSSKHQPKVELFIRFLLIVTCQFRTTSQLSNSTLFNLICQTHRSHGQAQGVPLSKTKTNKESKIAFFQIKKNGLFSSMVFQFLSSSLLSAFLGKEFIRKTWPGANRF